MDVYYAILMGVVQGVTEFLPVSSSAHLVLAEHFLGWEQGNLTFDVILHMATLVAILCYFRKDFHNLFFALLKKNNDEGQGKILRMQALYLGVATVPAVLFGLGVGKYAETVFRSPGLIAITLSSAGAILWLAERRGRKTRDLNSISIGDALVIGVAQAMAVIPGVSRSGATITAGLLLGLDRVAATRFSFLLAAPILAGAGAYKIIELIRGPQPAAGQVTFFLAGFLAASISGYVFITFLMKFVQTHSLAIFAYYRFGVSALVVMFIYLG